MFGHLGGNGGHVQNPVEVVTDTELEDAYPSNVLVAIIVFVEIV